jgi:hypothetical protein
MSSDEPIVIHLWCGPRTLSTATMYSFSMRPDCEVYDEPLYAAHLAKNPQFYRPYRDELLRSQCTDGNEVLSLLHSTAGKSIIVAKHMAKHTDAIDRSNLWKSDGKRRAKHVIIVRYCWAVDMQNDFFTCIFSYLPLH